MPTGCCSSRQSRGLVLSGSVIMLVGSGFVSLANFGYNISVAHLLGPGDFSHAAAAVTLLMLASCINLAFQLVAAKFIARNQQAGGRAAVYRTLMRQAWSVGLGLCIALLLLSEPISQYLRLPSKRLIEVLALGHVVLHPPGCAPRRNAGHLPIRPPERQPHRRGPGEADRGGCLRR